MRAAAGWMLVAGLALSGCAAGLDTSSSAVAASPIPPAPRTYASNCTLPHDDLPSYGEIVGADFGREAEPLVRVPPTYPDAARAAGVEGAVEMSALVCEHGKVLEVRVEKSIPLLDDAAMTAMSQWTFKPAERGGKPIASWVRYPVNFTLH